MSTTTNSFLRSQRKSDLLELAETVGLKKYVMSESYCAHRNVLYSAAINLCTLSCQSAPHCRDSAVAPRRRMRQATATNAHSPTVPSKRLQHLRARYLALLQSRTQSVLLLTRHDAPVPMA